MELHDGVMDEFLLVLRRAGKAKDTSEVLNGRVDIVLPLAADEAILRTRFKPEAIAAVHVVEAAGDFLRGLFDQLRDFANADL